MREIKFRAWDKLSGMINFDFDDLYYSRATINHGVYDVPIMQYTGLKDKRDEPIYEGDILEFSVFDHNGSDRQWRGVVKFSSGQWEIWYSVTSEFYGADGSFMLYWAHQNDDEIEIIGNIFQNEDLLSNPTSDSNILAKRQP